MRRAILPLVATLALAAAAGSAAAAQTWDEVLAKARGQTVYWNAWGGSQQTNDYIQWTAGRVREQFGVTVEHVKLTDTADAVARVIAEKSAGRTGDGSIDLIWINGENFAAMKSQGLLFGPFAERLPHYALVDVQGKPTTVNDFTVPVDGMESPWGMAQFVFVHDTATLPDPPRSIPAILAWAKANPGRFTYAQPPDFLGSTFLKQALYELVDDPARLAKPVVEAEFAAATAPLWSYLDQLHPALWRGGKAFPSTGPEQRQLLDDGEIDLATSFNPLEASSSITAGLLPETARVYVLEKGTIGNTNFVAIPFNASHKEGAMVVADFLLSPEAQARKQDARYWGSFTVLDLDKLSPEQKAFFDAIPTHPATPGPEELGVPLPEPHPSWMERTEAEWQKRYAKG
jgi:putative thiamine transport system substrate-binding protein